MEILTNFGLETKIFIGQIVNFLVMLFLLKKFAYKPILSLLEKRRKMIEESQKNAKKTEEALQHALEQEKKILKEAQSEAKTMIADANKQAEAIILAANDTGKQQVEKLIKDSNEQVERERKETEKALAQQVTKLSVDILQKSLQGFFDEKQQQEVLEKAVKALKK